MKRLQGKKILVSVGESCLGNMVAARLAELGAIVGVMGSGGDTPGPAGVDGRNLMQSVPPDNIENILGNPEVILYLDHPEILNNDMVDGEFPGKHLKGLIRLLRLAGKCSSHFVYASSSAVYGRQKYLPIDENHPLAPILIYGSIKMSGEYICRSTAMEEGFFYSILRYGDIYGPGVYCGDPYDFIAGAVKGKALVIKGSGGQVRSYLFIEDAVEATVKTVIYKPFNQIFNLSGNEYISQWHLANTIKRKYCQKCEIVTVNSILLDEVECCLDFTRAKEMLNFCPKVDLNSGIAQTYKWFNVNKKMK